MSVMILKVLFHKYTCLLSVFKVFWSFFRINNLDFIDHLQCPIVMLLKMN